MVDQTNFSSVFQKVFYCVPRHQKTTINPLKIVYSDFFKRLIYRSTCSGMYTTYSPGYRPWYLVLWHIQCFSTDSSQFEGADSKFDECQTLNLGGGGISSKNCQIFYPTNCYKLLKSLHLIGWEQICRTKYPTKRFVKCPPGLVTLAGLRRPARA